MYRSLSCVWHESHEAKTYYEINSATVTRYAPKAHGQGQHRTETQQTYRIAVATGAHGIQLHTACLHIFIPLNTVFNVFLYGTNRNF